MPLTLLVRFTLLGITLATPLAACGKEATPADAMANTAPPQAPRTDSYTVQVDGKGFHPDELSAPAGKSVTLTFTRTTDQTCAKEVVVPSQNLRRELPLNTPVEVAIAMPASGKVDFGCGMSMMHRGTLVVR